MKDSPLISVAMATYNGEKYLKEQLDSIYFQTYKNIEVIVTDDCSSDDTVQILEEYSKRFGLKYIVNKNNLGFVKNFEKAISLCKGDYIALSDQDDIWELNKLEILISEIGSNLLIHSDCSIIDDHGNIVQKSWKREKGNIDLNSLLFMNVVTGCTILMDKKLLNTVLPFPSGIAYHDWWLALCSAKEKKISYIQKSLVKYRQHDAQDTGAENLKQSSFQRFYLNLFNRVQGNETIKIIGCRKHLQNLVAVKNSKRCLEEDYIVFNDAITFFDNYLKGIVHFKTFFIGLKYHKILHPYKNYLYFKNILLDIIG